MLDSVPLPLPDFVVFLLLFDAPSDFELLDVSGPSLLCRRVTGAPLRLSHTTTLGFAQRRIVRVHIVRAGAARTFLVAELGHSGAEAFVRNIARLFHTTFALLALFLGVHLDRVVEHRTLTATFLIPFTLLARVHLFPDRVVSSSDLCGSHFWQKM